MKLSSFRISGPRKVPHSAIVPASQRIKYNLQLLQVVRIFPEVTS